MEYVYDLINKQTKQTEYKGIHCAAASKITGIPMPEIPWFIKKNRTHEKYSIVPVPIVHKIYRKEIPTWWKENDTARWNEIRELFKREKV